MNRATTNRATTNRATRLAATLLAAASLAACGHGGHDPAPVAAVQVAGLGLQLTRVGPESIRLDWSFDPYAAAYDVTRDGYPLASVRGTSLIDASGVIGDRYCYQVVGRDGRGVIVSTSSAGCLTLF